MSQVVATCICIRTICQNLYQDRSILVAHPRRCTGFSLAPRRATCSTLVLARISTHHSGNARATFCHVAPVLLSVMLRSCSIGVNYASYGLDIEPTDADRCVKMQVPARRAAGWCGVNLGAGSRARRTSSKQKQKQNIVLNCATGSKRSTRFGAISAAWWSSHWPCQSRFCTYTIGGGLVSCLGSRF